MLIVNVVNVMTTTIVHATINRPNDDSHDCGDEQCMTRMMMIGLMMTKAMMTMMITIISMPMTVTFASVM